MSKFRLILLASFCVVVIACASAPRYQNSNIKNVTINLSLGGTASMIKSIEAFGKISDLNKSCNRKYLGYVNLSKGSNHIGLDVGKMTYLEVSISRSHFGSSSSFSLGTVIVPKKNVIYEIDASYEDDMFDFRIYEVINSKRKNVELVPLPNCLLPN